MESNTSKKTDRVKAATPSSLNEEIEKQTWERVAQYMNRSSADLTDRIKQLEKEWDIERYLGINMSTVALSSLAAGSFSKNKRWLAIPAVVLSFFMQHSIQGWCPPLPLLRKLRIRTQREIEQEKYALKIIRGDFENVSGVSREEIEKLKQAIKRS